ncbi:MAG: hypothetical protein WBD55_02015 [Dehalococcoidia bacterium]
MNVELGRERLAINVGRLNLELSPPAVDLRSLPISVLPLAYICISSAIAVWLSPPEEVKAALALPSLAFLPLLIGSATFRYLPIDTPELDWFGRSLIGWLLGALVLTTFAVLLQLGGQAFLLERIGLIGLALAVVGFLITYVRSRRHRSIQLPITGIAAAALVVAMIIAVAPAAITAWYTPFPLISQNFLDPLFYSQPALRMLDHGYMDLDNLAHAPALLTLVAIHSQLYDVQPLSFVWMGPFLLHMVLGVGLFLWAREVSGRWTTGVLVAGIGVFILTGTILFQSTPVVMRSNTVLFALVPMCLYIMHRLVTESDTTRLSKIEGLIMLQLTAGVLFVLMNIARLGLFSNEDRVPLLVGIAFAIGAVFATTNRSRRQWPGVLAFFPIIVCFMAFHIYEGAIFLTAVIIYGFALSLRDTLFQPILALAISIGAVGFFYLQDALVIVYRSDFSLASSLVLGSTYNEIPITFATRIDEITGILSWEVITLLCIGAAGFFIRPRSSYGRAVLITASFLFIAYIMPDARAHRIGRAMAPFLALLFVAGADHVGWLARHAVRMIDRDRPIVQEIVQFCLPAAAFSAILLPFLHLYTLIPAEQSHHSKVADVEYAVADWFHDNTGENVRVISDYRTMQIVTSFANKVSLTERQLYPVELTDQGRAQMAEIKNSVLDAPSSEAAWSAIQRLVGSEPEREKDFLKAAGLSTEQPTYYVAWTGRTSLWVGASGIGPVRQTSVRDPYFYETDIFRDQRYFRLVANINDGAGYIYQVLPTPQP